MIYVDASVALSEVFSEDRRPPLTFWNEPLVASRLTDLEMRTRAAATDSQRAAVERLSSRISYLGITPETVDLIYTNGATGLRTLDAIHLATLAYVNQGLRRVPLATYDKRLAAAAKKLGFIVLEP